MTEENRVLLKDQMIPEFNITSSMDYPEQGMARIRGMIKEWAVTITWDYLTDQENVQLETMGIYDGHKQGPCPISKLKEVLQTMV